MKKIKISVVVLFLASLCMFSFGVMAESYDSNSKVTFTSVILPDACDNTTFAKTNDKGKTTNRSYGQVKMSSYKNCSSVDCWMRTKVNGTWHYWTPYTLTNISDKAKHKIKYCDASSSYYKKGVTAQLRGENAVSRIGIFSDAKVSGHVWFN